MISTSMKTIRPNLFVAPVIHRSTKQARHFHYGSNIPETSPLRELYADWEEKLIGQLMIEWQRKLSKLLVLFRRTYPLKSRYAKAGFLKQQFGNKAFWDEWRAGYYAMMLPLLIEAADIGIMEQVAFLEGFTISFDIPAAQALAGQWAKRYAGDLIKGMTRTDKRRIGIILDEWIASGEAFPNLVTKINQVVLNPVRAKMIAATESTRAYAKGSQTAWALAGIEAHRWETANDELVCPFCGDELAGQTVLLGAYFTGGIDGPPAHPNCRCWTVPVFRLPEGLVI